MEQTRKRNHVILVLAAVFFALLLWCAGGQEVKAETLKTQTVELDGILQNGDLLVEQERSESSSEPKARIKSVADFEQTVKAGLDNYQAADSNNEVAIDVSGCNVTVTEIRQKLTDFINTNPRYFYIDKHYSYTYWGNNVKSLFLILKDTPANVSKMLAEYDMEVETIVDSMDQSWSGLEKALYANDYLATNCEYDKTYSNYSAYDVFVKKTAVCQGYALAFQELMNQAGVNCELVTSEQLDHAWNLVNVNGSWYHVDTTWNDPTKDRIGRARHIYLLKSIDWLQSEKDGGCTGHAADDYVYTRSQTGSAASSTAYDDYFWNSIDNPFGYSDGYWYGNDNGTIIQYQGSASGLTSSKELKSITEKWYVWDTINRYWQGNFSGFSLYNGYIYYLLPTEIHKISCDGNDDTVFYSLTDDEKSKGYLYGLKINQYGDLTYGIATSPDAATINKEKDLCGHTYSGWTTEAATCEAVGVKKRTCSKCKKTQREILLATGHKHTKSTTTQPNFVKTGLQTTVCIDCGKTIERKTLLKKQCKKGQNYTVGNYKYKIVSPKTNGAGTVAFAGVVKDQAKVAIGNKVAIQGASFKIVQVSDNALKNKKKLISVTIGTNVSSIGKEAFSGAKKLKIITIKSTKLTKVGKNALKNIHKKAKVKVPGSKLKQYKKLFKGKGQKSTVKITK